MFDVDIGCGPARVCFTSRAGGISSGPHESMNLQTGGLDDPAAVATNFQRMSQALNGASIAVMNQVHGADIAWVDNARTTPTADALITQTPHLVLTVRVADCVPIVMFASDIGAIAAVHAGRAGLLAGVVPAAVESLYSSGASNIQAWLGPRACGSCYELPLDMAQRVEAHVPGTQTVTAAGTAGVDIGSGVRQQLLTAGVDATDLGADRCTIEDDTLFSYRRQGRESGRFAGLIMMA